MEKVPVTVLIQAKNEEVGIRACLNGVSRFEQVIVVDSNSTDRTAEIAREWGADVVEFTWDGGYPQKKQWQLDNVQTRHEWLLILDVDEFPDAALIDEIRDIASDPGESRVAFDLPISYFFAGRQLKHGHRVIKRSLLKRGFNRYPDIDVFDLPGIGELEAHYQPHADGMVGRTGGTLVHRDLDPVRSWFDRHNWYSEWEATIRLDRRLRADVRSSKSRQGQRFDQVPFKPLAFWAYSYVFRMGFLDGRAGLDYAVALAGYYWQIGVKVRELERLGGPNRD